MQERLIALHHLDAPWRPADVEQREGRILRQGNKNPVVSVFRYVTEGSFDAYMWQTLETKAKFIAQVMTGDMTIRRVEDLDSAALTYAEVKAIASGNPLVIEKAQVDAELMRLTRLRSAHAEEQYRIRSNLRHARDDAEASTARLANLRLDIGAREDTSGDNFRIELDGQPITNRGVAGELLIRRAEKLKNRSGDDVRVGRFAGFDLFICVPVSSAIPIWWCAGKIVTPPRVTDTALGTIRSLESTVQGFDERAAGEAGSCTIADAQKRANRTRRSRSGPSFDREERYQELTRRQSEIEEKLDLTKNQAPSQVEASPSDETTESSTEKQTIKPTVRPQTAIHHPRMSTTLDQIGIRLRKLRQNRRKSQYVLAATLHAFNVPHHARHARELGNLPQRCPRALHPFSRLRARRRSHRLPAEPQPPSRQ